MENQAIEMPDKLCNGCLFSVKLEREALELACQGLNKHVISDKYTLEELLELYESKKEIDFKLIDGSVIHGYLIGFVQDRSQVM